MSPARYRQVTIGALVALAVIIVTGAAVRLTNSGLGCDDWPNCSSERLIDVSSKHAAIEQINRFFTGVVGIAVIAAVLGSLVRRPRRRDLTVLSAWLVVGVIANAVLGGISVLVDLHPIAVQGHLLLSMALIVAAATLVRRAGEPDDVPRAPAVSEPAKRLVLALFVLTSLAVFTGTLVTGAGPHAGDEEAERLDIAIPTVARLHGATVMITIGVALLIAWRIRTAADDRDALVNPLSTWIFVGVLQAALGYVQYFNGVPELLVGLHVAGATAVMLVTTHVLLATTRPVADHAPAPAAPLATAAER
ncbi:MAG: COX15/CtaA family protein [Ilumatobacter sp.]|uniref:COX15/CtaA family protein n=1 Tax=Ilumatobacter sp. TaxID=1967498 RepID=UPI00263A1D92|nr:COX15/CtaA family protein [Ilumatobacter sp.]MDJ0769928.1 COX15/CtaA family protein [Ilumatobacter sp.]